MIMTIHVVQPGETLSEIAIKYQVSVDRLILENGIINPDNLVIGQTIVIAQPLLVYTVQNGDSLIEIANKNEVSLLQILQNNPYLVDREYIYPGETLVISYDTSKIGTMEISGYTYSFIMQETLRKALPYLTYLTIFHYQQLANGELVDIEDEEIIHLAKEYGVAPVMLVSTQSDQGESHYDTANILLNNLELQDRLIDNMIAILKDKGYYGLNQYLQFYTTQNKEVYFNYLQKLSVRVKNEGFKLYITISPMQIIEESGVKLEDIDYSVLLNFVDGLTFLTYNWGYSYSPPACATPVNLVREVLEYMESTVPTDEVFLGLPIIGYDWALPYIPGYSKGNAITPESAIVTAEGYGIEIQYNEISEAPFYFYKARDTQLHIVWFKDARSMDVFSSLVPEYNLRGLSIWNIMFFYTQMWFIINNKFEITKLQEIDLLINDKP
jgi:spore germination protein